MQNVKEKLIKMGFMVTIPSTPNGSNPSGIKDERTEEERTEDKIKHDLIREYYNKIKDADIVLVVNPQKNGIQGYIGGNTLIEMAFAHVLNKKLICLYPIPDLQYTSEIAAFQPIVLNGNLDSLNRI